MAQELADDEWQASTARHRFSEVIDAAVDGRPQTVRRRDGREVVIVSREYFDKNKPTLKSILLNFKFEHDDGSFEVALAEGRQLVGAVFTPTLQFQGASELDDAGHQRTERSAPRRKA